jgi:hypothetical protein
LIAEIKTNDRRKDGKRHGTLKVRRRLELVLEVVRVADGDGCVHHNRVRNP